jgi:hypothetical protein
VLFGAGEDDIGIEFCVDIEVALASIWYVSMAGEKLTLLLDKFIGMLISSASTTVLGFSWQEP